MEEEGRAGRNEWTAEGGAAVRATIKARLGPVWHGEKKAEIRYGFLPVTAWC
jgi:hypothetical protein